jgi:glyoxylate/hydroxypyruvate reductase A
MFHSDIDDLTEWEPELRRLLPNLECSLSTEITDPGNIDIALIWKTPPDINAYTNLRAILCLGAGVDQLDLSSLPRGVPLARLRDPELTKAMRQYCQWAVLRYHRDFHLYERFSQAGGPWRFRLPRPPCTTRVGVLGLGELGGSVARDLVDMGFMVSGWARTERSIDGVRCFIGADRLFDIAGQSDILINLLPLTADTEGILNGSLFEAMPRGSYLINVGRGRHLVDDDLIAALASGQIGGATLDVFRNEPLPADHPFWRNPLVLVTPHVASAANAATAAIQVVDNIRRAMRGDTLLNQVDRSRGY